MSDFDALDRAARARRRLARRLVAGMAGAILAAAVSRPRLAAARWTDRAFAIGVLDRLGQGAVDLNAATAAELVRLPGLGPALARRIVARRQRIAPFVRIEDLRLVPGLGQNRLRRIAPFVRVGAPWNR